MTTQELKDLLGYGFTLAKLVDNVVKGFKWKEIGEALDVVKDTPSAIAEAKTAFQEFLALDDSGRADVVAYVNANLELEEQGVEGAVKTVLDVVVGVTEINKLFKKGA